MSTRPARKYDAHQLQERAVKACAAKDGLPAQGYHVTRIREPYIVASKDGVLASFVVNTTGKQKQNRGDLDEQLRQLRVVAGASGRRFTAFEVGGVAHVPNAQSPRPEIKLIGERVRVEVAAPKVVEEKTANGTSASLNLQQDEGEELSANESVCNDCWTVRSASGRCACV